MKIDVDTNTVTSTVASGHRIYLIDPDVVNRSALFFMISDANEIYELESIEDIAEMDSQLLPDLVIVNASLVAKFGKALIQGWRIAWPRTRVLVICENCDADCITAANAAGADDTLQRPFNREEIRRKVERWAESTDGMKTLSRHSSSALHARH